MSPARFVGALSFEDRAVCGFESLADRVTEVTMLDYGAEATPGQAARAGRDRAWDSILRLVRDRVVDHRRVPINPYSMRDLEDLVLAGDPSLHTLVDVSCLTRPHVVAMARACEVMTARGRPWSVVYTTPLSYGNLERGLEAFGWRDTLVLPIGQEPSASNEGVSLGLVLLGQEAERLQIALDEVEPAAGYALHVVRPDRPDLYRLTLAANDLVLSHLRSLRMPGQRANAIRPMFPSLGWIERGIHVDSLLSELSDIVDSVTSAGRAAGAPIFLYPFGPKIGGFAAAYMLANRYPEASWCVYPIAVTHPLDYSEGCAKVTIVPDSDFLTTAVAAQSEPLVSSPGGSR